MNHDQTWFPQMLGWLAMMAKAQNKPVGAPNGPAPIPGLPQAQAAPVPANPAAAAPTQPPAFDGLANNPAASAPMQPPAFDGLPNPAARAAAAPAAKPAPLPPPRPAGLLGGEQQGPEDNPFARWLTQNGNTAMQNFGAGPGGFTS